MSSLDDTSDSAGGPPETALPRQEPETISDAPSEAAYDPFAPETLADPFAAHAELRRTCPVHHYPDFGDQGFYTLSRYDDVTDLFKSVERWSAEWGQGPIYVKEGGLKSDPPVHTVYRRLITGAFTGKRITEMAPMISATATELIDKFSEAGHADLCSDFAVPLPIIIVCKLIGIPPQDMMTFKEWSDEFMAAQNAADPEVQAAPRIKIDGYFSAELARRRNILHAAPTDATIVGGVLDDDILTSLLLADNEGRPFTDDELLPLLLLLLVGGNETTTSLIGSLVWRLLDLGLWEQVVNDESLWDAAIEESLRFDPPVMGMFRTAKGDQVVEGVLIPDEAKVEGLFASANRDAEFWDDPEAFRLDRDVSDLRRRHLSFGTGIWACPAAALARLEARIALKVLGERLSHMRLADEPIRVQSFMMWGPQTLPVAWDD